MSTFYVLPPRAIVGERFAAYLAGFFPGLSWENADWSELGDALGRLAAERRDVYVVYREELAPNEDLRQALRDGFGAEGDDEVIEVRPR